jgi:hypothetical protein
MKLEDKLRSEVAAKKLQRPPTTLQGVAKERIAEVLQALDRASRDQIDAVFALLDDINPSWFYEAAEKGLKVCHGASTAHIACHVGVLQRNGGKLDREGRDYWLKPLWEIGALEKLYFDSATAEFLPGHPVPKSPNSAYRIAPAFLQILKASDADRKVLLAAWTSKMPSGRACRSKPSWRKPLGPKSEHHTKASSPQPVRFTSPTFSRASRSFT